MICHAGIGLLGGFEEVIDRPSGSNCKLFNYEDLTCILNA